MIFSKDVLRDISCTHEGYSRDGHTVLRDRIIAHERWSVVHEMVFAFGGKYYLTTFQVAATEYQDCEPFDLCTNEVECIEVRPVTVATVEYRPVADDESANSSRPGGKE